MKERLPERRIPMARPAFGEEEEIAVRDVLRSAWVTQGPRVAEFEQRFAEVVGAGEAIAVSSCTGGLFLCLHAWGIGAGDEVIVPSLSFIASANVIAHAGATPVFADVDPRTYNVDPRSIERAIGSRTRAILPVHQLGFPADLEAITEIARAHDLRVLVDAACAAGSKVAGRTIGSEAGTACWSFHARKVIVTGDGGMITTDDPDFAARLRRLRHQGMSMSDFERHRSDDFVIETYPEIGYNFRMSDIHAAVGIAQLARLPGFVAHRREIAERYARAIATLPELELPFVPPDHEPNYQSYIVRLRDADTARRNHLIKELERRGVSSRRGLMASHLETAYAEARTEGALPHTLAASEQTFLLPIYEALTPDDQDYVVDALRDSLASCNAEQGS